MSSWARQATLELYHSLFIYQHSTEQQLRGGGPGGAHFVMVNRHEAGRIYFEPTSNESDFRTLAFPNLKYSYLEWIFKRPAVYIHGVPISNICIYLFWIRNFLLARRGGAAVSRELWLTSRHVCLCNVKSEVKLVTLYLRSQIFNLNRAHCDRTMLLDNPSMLWIQITDSDLWLIIKIILIFYCY